MAADRITLAQLERLCDRINHAVNGEDTPTVAYEDGEWRIGVYTLDGAYGGYALDRISSDGGGTTAILGRGTKRGLYDRMQAFLTGVDEATWHKSDDYCEVSDDYADLSTAGGTGRGAA